ncbi:type II/IV secretion system protein [Patescibacteria group bacterium]|nr:type II/IV secretion system protein [Patescibacteria group bacterium]
MLPVKDLRKIITSSKLLSSTDFKEAQLKAKISKTPLEKYLIAKGLVAEDDLYKKAAELYELPTILLEKTLVPSSVLDLIPENIAGKYQMAPFKLSDDELHVATCLSPNLQILEFIERKEDVQIRLFFAPPSSVHAILAQYRKDIEAEVEKVDTAGKELDVVSLIDGIIGNAIKEGASDIHIEPKELKTLVRYRKDGILHDIISLPKEIHAGVVTRIKILSNLRVDEHRLPQDGRIHLSGPGYRVSIRVSIVPILDGEKVVMRILHQEKRFAGLDELGLQPGALAMIEKEIQQAQGTILVVGPTGSGKTTTLYTLINLINKPGINISTIEDPIEYSLEDINQSQVKPEIGFTFAAGLRSFLRQDPDVIMVGEIRDEETAEIAMHAALTGHLVLSTLHTNDAPSTLPRLLEMGIPPYLMATTISLVIAQRLVRRICTQCKHEVSITEAQKKQIETELGINVKDILSRHGIKNPMLTSCKGEGCELCHGTGLKGRVGIFELLDNTPEVYAAILREASSREMYEIARKQGMMTLAEDGVLKILKGMTTFEELMRVL